MSESDRRERTTSWHIPSSTVALAAVEMTAFVGFVSLGAGLRIMLQDLPNFAPVAALALFAGFWFRSKAMAAAVPLAVMVVSDTVIGGYAWQMMVLVYAFLTLPAFFGAPLRRQVERDRGRGLRSAATVMTCSLTASLSFFAASNFGAWLWFNSYPHTVQGLMQCYAAALPFFRYTFAGDLLFATLLFGAYGIARQLVACRTSGTVRVSSSSS